MLIPETAGVRRGTTAMNEPTSCLRIKICGHTNPADAMASAAAGADLVGVILFPGSRRFVPFDRAAQWVGSLPAGVERVAVFVDPTIGEVRAALADGLFHTAQLHGSEPPEFFREESGPCWHSG